MGWAADQRHRDADRHRREREQDHARHRAEREADRERHQLETLRMRAVAEEAKGAPGVWTREYNALLASVRARQEAQAKVRRAMLLGCGAMFAFGMTCVVITIIIQAVSDAVPPPKPVPAAPARRKR